MDSNSTPGIAFNTLRDIRISGKYLIINYFGAVVILVVILACDDKADFNRRLSHIAKT